VDSGAMAGVIFHAPTLHFKGREIQRETMNFV
jgi:hypothetical protein